MDMEITENVGTVARSGGSKRGTPNKRWKQEYDNFLIPLLVEQAGKGLKCDKTFKKPAFVIAAAGVNNTFKTDFTAENVENHYRTLKARYLEIKKARDLSGAGWNDELKMITLDPVVCKTYTDAHPAAKPYINKPIDNYEGLRVICGDDQATGSYATSVFSDFGSVAGNDHMTPETVVAHALDETDDEENADTAPPVAASSAASSSVNKVRRSGKKAKAQEDDEMADLIKAVSVMADAIKNPTHWSELLYAKVMEVEGFNDEDKETVFDYLEENEHAARRFMAKRVDMRYVWMKKHLSPME